MNRMLRHSVHFPAFLEQVGQKNRFLTKSFLLPDCFYPLILGLYPVILIFYPVILSLFFVILSEAKDLLFPPFLIPSSFPPFSNSFIFPPFSKGG